MKTVGFEPFSGGLSILASGGGIPLLGGLFGGQKPSTNIQSQSVSTNVASSTNVVVGGGYAGTPTPTPIPDYMNSGFKVSSIIPDTTPLSIANALNPSYVAQNQNQMMQYIILAAIIGTGIFLVAKSKK